VRSEQVFHRDTVIRRDVVFTFEIGHQFSSGRFRLRLWLSQLVEFIPSRQAIVFIELFNKFQKGFVIAGIIKGGFWFHSGQLF